MNYKEFIEAQIKEAENRIDWITRHESTVPLSDIKANLGRFIADLRKIGETINNQ